MATGYLPDTSEIQEATKKLRTVRPQARAEILGPKSERAVIAWAIVAMGENVSGYLRTALNSFYTRAALLLAKSPELSAEDALRGTPFLLSLKLKRLKRSSLSLDPQELLERYDNLLCRVQEIKKKRWRNTAALGITLKSSFPGVPETVLKRFSSVKASDFAVSLLRWQYKLEAKANEETLKKVLVLARHPERVVQLLLREIVLSSIPRTLVKPVSKP